MEHLSDSEILAMFRNSEQKNYAFTLLVNKYQKRIYFFVRRMLIIHEDADDVVQNVFIKVWKNLDGYRGDSSLFTWIYRISVNESNTYLRNRRLRNLFTFQSFDEEMLKDIQDDFHFDGDDIQRKLRKAIVLLPRKQQMVFNMRYFEDLSYEQIAQILGTSIGALKASYHIAAKKVEQFVLEN